MSSSGDRIGLRASVFGANSCHFDNYHGVERCLSKDLDQSMSSSSSRVSKRESRHSRKMKLSRMYVRVKSQVLK